MFRKVIVILLMNAMSSFSFADNFCPNIRRSSEHSKELQFTKDTIDRDYAINGDRKWLHCCARGYRTIEWWVWNFEDISMSTVWGNPNSASGKNTWNSADHRHVKYERLAGLRMIIIFADGERNSREKLMSKNNGNNKFFRVSVPFRGVWKLTRSFIFRFWEILLNTELVYIFIFRRGRRRNKSKRFSHFPSISTLLRKIFSFYSTLKWFSTVCAKNYTSENPNRYSSLSWQQRR